jgi:endonuclease/exonuclease/phosphatase family metal-dependent hydrolase
MRPVPEITVASFNTHWGIDRHGRPFDVVDVCRGLEADVIALQEIWHPNGGPGFVDDVAAALGMTVLERVLAPDTMQPRPKKIPIPPGPPGTWGVALLSRLPVCERFEVDLGHAPGDSVARRIGLCAELDACGHRFVFAAVHASHRLYGSPPQLRRLARALDERGQPNVIGGDCNMWGAVLAPVLRTRRRGVRGPTWPAWFPHSQIDHLWVSEGFELCGGDVMARTASDHRPVRARLRLTG